MPDFSQLLSQPVDSFERPKPIPAGTYHGRITTFSVKEAQNEKKTPFVRLDLSLDSAGTTSTRRPWRGSSWPSVPSTSITT